ncbi:hypothetical protein [Lentilactobacillus farraginis]|nr:hypothetical protein [Lentilactobacillus farraginis]
MDKNIPEKKRRHIKAWYKDRVCWLLVIVVIILVLTSLAFS